MWRITANLNYFFVLVLVGSMTLAATIAPPIRRLFLHGKGIALDPIYLYFNYITIALVMVIVSAAWWMRGNIIPTPVNSKAKMLMKVGTIAMAIGNGALVLTLIASLIGVTVEPQFGLGVGYLFAAALMLAFPSNLVGIVFVEISRLLDRFSSKSS